MNSNLCPSDVKLEIFNSGTVKNSSNVMGIIRGSVEPGETDLTLGKSTELALFFQAVIFLRLLCARVHRQVCDLWESQGQLGSWCHRPEQRNIGHAGNNQGAGQDGQTR